MMARVYADLIRKGYKTLEDVPAHLREEVAQLLEPQNTAENAGDE